ncbi:hypothetical protein [Maricaulis salignorans]|uniref:DoxX-like family protein n=1 Tax=Maricaulis salignorans TaxID=144026 RepID=A0A1G9VXP3_9PROT|nr:hypothetical protein [Maricaulis salignorans]SDM76711.1 hypothetical protein SAMN04488568_12132 [Maricaulis salignorans]
MQSSPQPDLTRFAHHLFTALLLAQLILPLFFTLQITLVWMGADAWTVSPERVRVTVRETPLPAIIAPFLRCGLIMAMLYTHHRAPRWTLPLLLSSILIHIIGWTSIVGNPYFNAPTGYVTLTIGSALLILLVLNPALQKPRS